MAPSYRIALAHATLLAKVGCTPSPSLRWVRRQVHDWSISGSGEHSTFHAAFEYTFPLDFAELVWSDGAKVERKIISLKDSLPFGKLKELNIPFDARGKKWVRLAIWDAAGDGAWLQPVQPH